MVTLLKSLFSVGIFGPASHAVFPEAKTTWLHDTRAQQRVPANKVCVTLLWPQPAAHDLPSVLVKDDDTLEGGRRGRDEVGVGRHGARPELKVLDCGAGEHQDVRKGIAWAKQKK